MKSTLRFVCCLIGTIFMLGCAIAVIVGKMDAPKLAQAALMAYAAVRLLGDALEIHIEKLQVFRRNPE